MQATVSNTRVGTGKACERAQMPPAAPGQVAALNVVEGEQVQAGGVLLEIWNQDRKAEMRLAEAEASAAHSRAARGGSIGKVARAKARLGGIA